MTQQWKKPWRYLGASALLIAIMFTLTMMVQTPTASAAGKGTKTVGAIRWDAWVGDLNTDGVGAPYVGQQVERALGPNKYHFRLPFYGVETGTNTVQARELTQTVMDQDIAYAKNAGIDYWAFVYYPDNSGMDTARNLYFSSTHKSDVNYCFITGASSLPTSSWLVSKFLESNYQKVLSGRPLMYIFGGTGGYTASQITSLRNASIAAGAGNPYVVVMGSASDLNTIGADALSAYNTWATGGGAYSGLINADQNNWNADKNTGKKVIPWVTTGIDTRPRYDNPVTWTSVGPNDWVQTATPGEIANNLQNSLDWIDNNSSTAEANTTLIYAWNEFDEGGWISPTLFNGTDRLDAIHQVLYPSVGGTDGPNLALNKTYSSSTNWDANQTAAKAFDGSLATNWQSSTSDGYSNSWLQVDFGAATTFNKFRLSEYGNRTGGYHIDYYGTDSLWHTAFTGTILANNPNYKDIILANAVTGSKLKIVFTSGSYTPIIYEFEVYNSVANLALGKTYSSSSNWDANQTAANAFDGSLSTNWQSSTADGYNGSWLQVDLGSAMSLKKFRLTEYGGRTAGYHIDYYGTDNAWHTAYTGTTLANNPSFRDVVLSSAVTGSMVRVVFTSGTYTPIIYEFEVYSQ